MYIKARFKLMRKHNCDFWSANYYRVTQNRFFRYYKHSLGHTARELNKMNSFKFLKSTLQFFNLEGGANRAKSPFNPFLNEVYKKGVINRSPFQFYIKGYFYQKRKSRLKINGKINYHRIFGYRSLRYVTHVYKRAYFRKREFKGDLLLGIKRKRKIFTYKRLKFNVLRRFYFQQLSLYYNNFNLKKLRRFGKLSRKSKFGGVNYFFMIQ
jgi:hypothetical protein